MLSLRYPPAVVTRSLELNVSRSLNGNGFVVCSLKGPRPRYPRVWKSRKRIGTISKSTKLIECIKGLSNVKEEVYGALDSFVAWELEFPLITVKKVLKTLEREKEWKRLIQVTKWMLSKGQGKTKGSYYTLLNALAEDGRLEEAEDLWAMIFSENLENLPREFFSKMISIYYNKGMHEKMFEVFADMEELGVRPNGSIIEMLGNVFQELGMLDKYEKLMKKYPPTIWEYRYFKGKRVRTRSKVGLEYNAKVSLSEHRNGVYEDDNAKVSQLEHSNGVDEEANAEVSQLKPPHRVDLEASAQVPNLEYQNGVGEEPNAQLPQGNHQHEVDEEAGASLPQLMHQNTINVEADSSLLS
ncbi:pentatricopeptide repeat-containing protein [Cinnamomum micranthum f. kanehirae]|uniref:Pentatricopeptide repeat-containing protein n=1 Tax=Cinnamomum micranthum f. kanehirae TaxID=337451 RepID=A0A3S4PN08_9MAGN|nr:pentatricopeptide repeat-containing protein [Cinnamomum micranthum f. kanehirae]